MTESRVTKSWIEATMAEADAKYAAAYGSGNIYSAQSRIPAEFVESPSIVVAQDELDRDVATEQLTAEQMLPRPVRRTGWRRTLHRMTRASSFMIVGAGLMLGIISTIERPRVVEVTTPQTLQDPLAMLASIAPRITNGEIIVEDSVALDALQGQLDTIRESAFATLIGNTPGDDQYITRVYGGVFTVPYEGSVLIGPPDAEPSLISFNRSQASLFGGNLNGEYITMRVGDVNAHPEALPQGCTLALASLQREESATFLLRCR
ncbi:hypothetical protein [Pontivivens insulae]|uniref:Uncharacterized protein n=1 Tax=Pontivivens insulae TaxID=1639689 RepID=A0A2R8ADT0_9RHOB|nr:hypothetical protein [Pontivivens insulae]RED14144.1 hypothetical protein DFR53_1499 [Pontivivens insulae]SPF30220.1 hypothetical protein POI8812_02555 [Pontivivens insulae]